MDGYSPNQNIDKNFSRSFFISAIFMLAVVFFFPQVARSDYESNLKTAEVLYKKGQFLQSAHLFYQISRKSKLQKTVNHAKYGLGLSLSKMQLHLASSYPFTYIINAGTKKIRKNAIERLIQASRYLNNTSILNSSVKDLTIEQLEETKPHLFFHQTGEFEYNNRHYEQAILAYQKSANDPQFKNGSLYNIGLSYLRLNKLNQAIETYDTLYRSLESLPPNNVQRVQAALALARAHYQAKKWDSSIQFFRLIPKDSVHYRSALLGLSWAYFRSGKLRSALATIQTVHTPFYENYYDPEVLFLRAIIFYYICNYEDVRLTYETFNEISLPIYQKLLVWLDSQPNEKTTYTEITNALELLKKIKKGLKPEINTQVPFSVTRTLIEERPIKTKLLFLIQIESEISKAKKLFKNNTKLPLYRYIQEIYKSRRTVIEAKIARYFHQSLHNLANQMSSYYTQFEFLKYEMYGGMKIQIKYGQHKPSQIDFDYDRNFYLKAGYDYWPFQGEYWRDELGNYQFLGENRCIK